MMVFVVVISQISDILQYVWGSCFRKPCGTVTTRPTKPWKGLLDGVLTCGGHRGIATRP